MTETKSNNLVTDLKIYERSADTKLWDYVDYKITMVKKTEETKKLKDFQCKE